MSLLSDVITLLSPRAVGTKVLYGAGSWAVRRSQVSRAGFGLVLKGECWLAIDGQPPVHLTTGDFVLMPECPGFTIASSLDGEAISLTAQDDSACSDSEVRYGDPKVEADFEQLGGYFQLDPVNQGMLARLLPTLVHIRSSDPAADSIKRTIDLIVEEATANHPGRALVVDRLIEILLVKSLRYDIERIREINQPGLALGLLDPALARALRQLHHDVARQWTVDSLAREAGLSRSSFSQRFSQRVGVPPMQYLIDWRMALAKAMLKGDSPPLEVVAGAIGYQSASAFSTAFRREIGCSPTEFSRGAID